MVSPFISKSSDYGTLRTYAFLYAKRHIVGPPWVLHLWMQPVDLKKKKASVLKSYRPFYHVIVS